MQLTMISHVFISFLLVKFGSAQENGEFWWLNDKFANYVGTRPPAPMFVKLSERDNDENAKIIFRDHSFFSEGSSINENTNINDHNKIQFSEVSKHNIFRWPEEDTPSTSRNPKHSTEDQIQAAPTGDPFIFKFPVNDSDEKRVIKKLTDITNQATVIPATVNDRINISKNSTVLHSDKLSFALYYKDKLSESICTYLKKSDCYQNKGALNIDVKDEKKYTFNRRLVCCILPMKSKNENVDQKLSYPGEVKLIQRVKRSNNRVKNQRHILLSRNYADKNQPIQTPNYDYEYDEEDPYVNIKNHKKQNNHNIETHTSLYDSDAYHDYEIEIPSPGLGGFYSDALDDKKQNPYGGPSDYESEERTDFGYSTIDPRIGKNKRKKTNVKTKPVRLTTTPYEIDDDFETQTISYHSVPNFNALQDFKLPNLTRKKILKNTRTTSDKSSTNTDQATKHIRSTTSERISTTDSDETTEIETSNTFPVTINHECKHQQIFKECGKTLNNIKQQGDNGETGDARQSSHPWLAILVKTQKQNKLLCYASIIHPRAAITAGDCVHGIDPGDITLLAGLWNLTERPKSGKRIVTSLLHPKYKSGHLSHNLALLHWTRPLKLGPNVNPICLANPEFEQTCVFVGWGGFDQAIRPQSRWQRTTIHICTDHTSLIEIDIPPEAFCASVKTRSTVTGMGGSLVCKTDDQLSAVGVAVSRDSTLILLPIHDWLTSPNILNLID